MTQPSQVAGRPDNAEVTGMLCASHTVAAARLLPLQCAGPAHGPLQLLQRLLLGHAMANKVRPCMLQAGPARVCSAPAVTREVLFLGQFNAHMGSIMHYMQKLKVERVYALHAGGGVD